MASDLKFGADYQDKFDSECYLKAFYSSIEGSKDETGVLLVVIELLHKEFYKSNKHTGKRLLDFGTGPTIHSIISASSVYTDITLSDYSESNRQQLQKWVNRDKGAHDWIPIISYIASLEENISSPESIEERIRKSIREVLPCDVLKQNPLHPNIREPYDCILTSLCLEACSSHLESYKQSVKHMSTLLKPNGICVVVGVLEETFYEVGKYKFFALKLSADDVKSAFKEAGFTDIDMQCTRFSNTENPEQNQPQEMSDFRGNFVMSAKEV